MEVVVGRGKKVFVQGDISELETDAIVNAANAPLELGGSTSQEDCHRLGSTHVGGAVITGAGELKAKHVIHE